MNVAEINITPYAARQAAAHYLKEVRARHRKEDQEILAGYRALARAERVISLDAAMRSAGFTPDGYPKLAISRADQLRVQVRVHAFTGDVYFIPQGRGWWEERIAAEFRFKFRRLAPNPPRNGNHLDGWAYVPLTPPQLRPANGLSKYHVLFEAEWHRQPPVDPLLLKRIGADLFAIVAHWNLTELERAVIGVMR